MSTLRDLEVVQLSPRLLEVLRRHGLADLTQFQKDSVKKGLTKGASQILVTWDYEEAYKVAEIALLNRVVRNHRAKGIILCANPDQAEMRFKSIAIKCRRLGITVTEAIRTQRAIETDWKSDRIFVATYESLGIALRTHPEILEGLFSVIIERLDLIGQPGLGPQLETDIVRLMSHNQELQYIAISSPVSNIDDLASWLGADVIEDNRQDVKTTFSVKSFDDIESSIAELTEFVQQRRGQTMILVPNTAACEELAEKLAGFKKTENAVKLNLRLEPEHRDKLRKLANKVMKVYSDCSATLRLAKLVQHGIAYFHDGVASAQRRAISDAWEERTLPVIVIPTRYAIASGMRASLIFLLGVYIQEIGDELSETEDLAMISDWQLSDVLQAAGRRGYDNDAFGIVVVGTESERLRVLEKYFVETEDGGIEPRLGEVDSSMDNPESIQDLVLRQLCSMDSSVTNPFSIIGQTFWASINRSFRVTDESILPEDESVDALIRLRSTKSTLKRAGSIPDEDVKLVSITPSKIVGLVHSGSREIWHYVTLKSTDGLSCSCESWKYQGIKNHRLCKHLVKFSQYALKNEEAKSYAAGVIEEALRSLEIVGDLERDGLVVRSQDGVRCTELGNSVTVLGVPVKDAKRVLRELSGRGEDLQDILVRIIATRSGIPEDIVERILGSITEKSATETAVCEELMPGLVETVIEDTHYSNTILLRILGKYPRSRLRPAALELDKRLQKLMR